MRAAILATLIIPFLLPLTACKKKGCTDKTAVNYDASAKVDDGSCRIPGCTDATATNYNPKATEDDGSCTYPLPSSGTYTDSRDGQTYNYKTIGSDAWMTKNMNYVTSASSNCYENDPANCNEFGRLYSYAALTTVCPSGWHLPSEQEWLALADHLGGMGVAADHLKVGGSSGFEGKYGGFYHSDFGFLDIDSIGWWWSSTPESFYGNRAYLIDIGSPALSQQAGSSDKSKLSCRCVRD